jgi:hypothetical protein
MKSVSSRFMKVKICLEIWKVGLRIIIIDMTENDIMKLAALLKARDIKWKRTWRKDTYTLSDHSN